MTYELRVLEQEDEIEQALQLRVRVWREANVALPVDARGCHQDSDDAVSTHVGAMIGRRLVAASRISLLSSIGSLSFARQLSLDPGRYPGAVCFLSRLIVAPEARGRGLGRSLIERMVIQAHEQGAAWTAATSSVRMVEDVFVSLRFVHADDVKIWWGHDWRAEKFFIADTVAAALEVRERTGRRDRVAPTGAASRAKHRQGARSGCDDVMADSVRADRLG
jgi:GNAT superfamily N-acetyltransferase